MRPQFQFAGGVATVVMISTISRNAGPFWTPSLVGFLPHYSNCLSNPVESKPTSADL